MTISVNSKLNVEVYAYHSEPWFSKHHHTVYCWIPYHYSVPMWEEDVLFLLFLWTLTYHIPYLWFSAMKCFYIWFFHSKIFGSCIFYNISRFRLWTALQTLFCVFSNTAFHRVLPLNVFKAIHYIWMVEVLYNVERVRHERFFYFNTFYKLSFSKSFKRMNTIVVDSNAMW